MGLNLTDRIILAGDTKVTNTKTKETLGYCMKVIQFADRDEKNFVSCAFAGNKHFIMYLAEELRKAIFSGELDTDINWLVANIDQFFKKVVPLYQGKDVTKETFMIFGGVSKDPSILKAFDGDIFSKVFGSGGGRIDDENLIFAMQTGFRALPCREQKIFSYSISSPKNIFGIDKVGGVYSFIFGGSTSISTDIQDQVRRIFVDKRKKEDEARDVINLLRSKYSNTIGGAVTIGFIDAKGVLIFVGYDVDKKGNTSEANWSTLYEKGKIIGLSPEGKKVDLVAGFYDPMPANLSLDIEI